MTDSQNLPGLLAAEADWLHRLARALLRDGASVADLAQDTLALALKKRPDLGTSSLRARGWLRATAQRLAWASLRAGSSRNAHEAEAAARSADCRAIDEQSVDRLKTHQVLVSTVRSLHEPYRSTIVMRYFEDCSPREAAQRRGILASTARQHIKRGLERDNKCRPCATPTPWISSDSVSSNESNSTDPTS